MILDHESGALRNGVNALAKKTPQNPMSYSMGRDEMSATQRRDFCLTALASSPLTSSLKTVKTKL